MRMRWAQSLSERLTGERVTPPSRTVTWASAAACHHCATEERRSTEGRTDRARWHGWSGWKKAATFTVTGKHTNVVVFSLSFFFLRRAHNCVCLWGWCAQCRTTGTKASVIEIRQLLVYCLCFLWQTRMFKVYIWIRSTLHVVIKYLGVLVPSVV